MNYTFLLIRWGLMTFFTISIIYYLSDIKMSFLAGFISFYSILVINDTLYEMAKKYIEEFKKEKNIKETPDES